MPTILHISDLHRSPNEPIDNDTLLASILADIDRHSLIEEAPGAIILSGDLVQGVPIGTDNFDEEMDKQYAVAYDLVDRLCKALLNNKRENVVIVPGNHDICWNSSEKSMKILQEGSCPADLRSALAQKDGALRWSWHERQVYKVTSKQAYNGRLNSFWKHIENFYQNSKLPIEIDRDRGYQLFSIFEGKMLVAGFESTHRNDHLRYEAELATGVVSKCRLKIRELGLQPSLMAAVWHHSVNGPPSREDYLNIESVREMAGLGFQLGFHGHQHLAESTDLSVSVAGSTSMCVISAGSLCAGWNDLPRGTDRQYNLVKIDETYSSGTLHIREMVEGNQFAPRTRGRFIEGKVRLQWSPRLYDSGRLRRMKLDEVALSVEEAVDRQEVSENTASLLSFRPQRGTFPHRILLRALQIEKNWAAILEYFWPPVGSEETTLLAEAAYRAGDQKRLSELIDSADMHSDVREYFSAKFLLLKSKRP